MRGGCKNLSCQGAEASTGTSLTSAERDTSKHFSLCQDRQLLTDCGGTWPKPRAPQASAIPRLALCTSCTVECIMFLALSVQVKSVPILLLPPPPPPLLLYCYYLLLLLFFFFFFIIILFFMAVVETTMMVTWWELAQVKSPSSLSNPPVWLCMLVALTTVLRFWRC